MAAGTTVDLAHGMTVTFGTSAFTGQLIDVEPMSPKRETVDVTHQGVAASTATSIGNALFLLSDVQDAGELTFTVHANTGGAGATQIPPIWAAAETITVRMPLFGTNKRPWMIRGSGGVTDCKLNAKFKDKITWDITVKWLGGLTMITASTSTSST